MIFKNCEYLLANNQDVFVNTYLIKKILRFSPAATKGGLMSCIVNTNPNSI